MLGKPAPLNSFASSWSIQNCSTLISPPSFYRAWFSVNFLLVSATSQFSAAFPGIFARLGRGAGMAEQNFWAALATESEQARADLRASPHGRERVVSWPLVASSGAGNFFSAPESIFSAGALASALASGAFGGPGGAGVAASLLLPGT